MCPFLFIFSQAKTCISDAKIKLINEKINNQEKDLVSLQSELTYKINVIETLKNDRESIKCLICRDNMLNRRLTILPCAHQFCFECIYDWFSTGGVCPYCNTISEFDSIMCPMNANEEDQISRLDYGSKFYKMNEHILETFEANPNARIVIYVQFKIIAENWKKNSGVSNQNSLV